MGSTADAAAHKIVALEGHFFNIPTLKLPEPHSHTINIYSNTKASEVPGRIKEANIILLTTVRLDAELLSEAYTPNLKLIVVLATGTDSIDIEACKARGITVCNCPHANVTSVSEHAIAMYFGARRKMMLLHEATRKNQWIERGTLMGTLRDKDGKPPLTCAEETMGIIGYGAVGKRVGELAKMLGMKLLIASRKGAQDCPAGRTPFEQVIKESTVLVLAVPRMKETLNLISTEEFLKMRHEVVIVNVSRGGIVDDRALVAALKDGVITGAASDVFEKEPAGVENTPLLEESAGGLNLTVTPHLAWFAEMTQQITLRLLQDNLTAWCLGKPQNVIA